MTNLERRKPDPPLVSLRIHHAHFETYFSSSQTPELDPEPGQFHPQRLGKGPGLDVGRSYCWGLDVYHRLGEGTDCDVFRHKGELSGVV